MELSAEQKGQYTVVTLAGRIDWENARELELEISRIVDEGAKYVVLSLEGVSFICSGGIGALAFNFTKLGKMGGAMYVISSNKYINHIFETLKFHIVFAGHFFDSYEQFSREVLGVEGVATQ